MQKENTDSSISVFHTTDEENNSSYYMHAIGIKSESDQHYNSSFNSNDCSSTNSTDKSKNKFTRFIYRYRTYIQQVLENTFKQALI